MAVLDEIRQFWDDDAAVYDDAPGHNPRTGPERAAWTAALAQLLPPPPARVLDCGAGTGFLSLIAARLGHQVTALDLSENMLARLQHNAKAENLSDRIAIVHGPATDPPPGAYDAVMERHVMWSLPDSLAALGAWRGVAGRLLLIESLWGQADPFEALRGRVRAQLHRWQGRSHDHHGEYTDEMRAALPLGRGTSPAELVALVEKAGWTAPQLVRLRDVEWATRLALTPVDRLLGPTPRFAVTADRTADQGERATDLADRADRSADQGERATDLADRGGDHADRSADRADRGGDHADRSADRADRADRPDTAGPGDPP
jgi:SAM-dependent methyltransferase